MFIFYHSYTSRASTNNIKLNARGHQKKYMQHVYRTPLVTDGSRSIHWFASFCAAANSLRLQSALIFLPRAFVLSESMAKTMGSNQINPIATSFKNSLWAWQNSSLTFYTVSYKNHYHIFRLRQILRKQVYERKSLSATHLLVTYLYCNPEQLSQTVSTNKQF